MSNITDTKAWAGQRLMIGFDGLKLDQRLKDCIAQYRIGGVILFARNIESPDQVRTLIADIQAHAGRSGLAPLLVAVDQEGGQVARLKAPFTRFPGNPALRDEADAIHFARVTAAELAGVGFNMNMAPVLDVAPLDIQSIMAGRAFGHDPDHVARMGQAVIAHLQAGGVMAVAKHFPGIGRTVLDSHQDLPVCDIAIESLESFDLPPFMAAMAQKVSGIMLSHIMYPKIDPDWPASLSTIIVNNLLRTQLGYDGLVLTDDLDMGAIAPRFDFSLVMERIMAAEVDISLICHDSDRIDVAFEALVKGAETSVVLEAAARRSWMRIFHLKNRFLDSRLNS